VIRPAAALLYGLMAGAAAPPLLPVPPLPLAEPPADEAAPVPNLELHAPDAAVSQHAALSLQVFRMKDYATGLGFVPGSAYASPEDRKRLQTPGFIVSLPVR